MKYSEKISPLLIFRKLRILDNIGRSDIFVFSVLFVCIDLANQFF